MKVDSRKWCTLLCALAVLALTAARAHAILPLQHWQTASGANVYFVENRDLPMLDVSVDFPAGSGFGSAQKSGLAALTLHLLKFGAGGLGEDDISRRLADVGAVLGGRFDTDRAGMSLRTLSSEREAALDVLARVLQQPEFPAAALEREKARIVSALKDADSKPESIASRAFSRLVYREHPYGLRSSGELTTVPQLVRADLAEFYRAHYVADRAVVAIMGDVSRQQADEIAERLTAKLPRAQAAEVALPQVLRLEHGELRVIAHPASQAHILIGAPGIRRDDADYFPLFLGNYVLGGGGFASRLNEEVRQKRGLAYSVYSYFSPLKQQGPFQIGLQTRKESADEALKVVSDTLRQFIASGPTEKELKAAKDNIIGGFPMRIDSNRKIHEYLALIGFYRLPLTYLDDFVANIEKVTAADIKSAFARRVDPDALITVVVGGVNVTASADQN
jgi:zinc protease